MDDIQANRLDAFPDAVYYIPEFITPAEEDHLVNKIDQSPLPKWKTVPTGRRLQYWGGILTKSNTLIPEPLPLFFTQFPDLISKVKSTGAFEGAKIGKPNQVLVNEYLPGQGIDPHTDGPAYYPTTTTISLLWPCILWLHPPSTPLVPSTPSSSASSLASEVATLTRPAIPILLEPRSLLVLQHAPYTEWKHSISHAYTDDFKAVAPILANKHLLGGQSIRHLVGLDAPDEGSWDVQQAFKPETTEGDHPTGVKRMKRISLTLRCVEKVGKGLFGR